MCAALLATTACNYLDIVPQEDIETIETMFEKREEADTWVTTIYSFLQMPLGTVFYNPAYTGTDELVTGNWCRNYYGIPGFMIANGLQMTQSPYGNIWLNSTRDGFYAGIRYCNIFITNIDAVYNMADMEKRQWKAEVKAAKAMMYFELMRRYGPITLVPDNIDSSASTEAMQRPRSPIDECFDAVLTLLDEAMPYLLPMEQKDINRRGYFSLEGAMALKARVLLYAASPLFNDELNFYSSFVNREGKQMFLHRSADSEERREKWRLAEQAAKDAIDVCLSNGKRLYSGTADKSTPLRNTMYDIEKSTLDMSYTNPEVLFFIRTLPAEYQWYPYLLPMVTGATGGPPVTTGVYGCFNPTMKMVEMYHTRNGLPVDEDREWNYANMYRMGLETNTNYQGVVARDQDVLNLHLMREPRFYAHIAADRCYWQLGPGADDDNYIVRPYQGETFGTTYNIISTNPQNITGYWLKKHLYSDEAKLNSYQSMASLTENVNIYIRMAELYLIAAEARNEYLGAPDGQVYDYLNEVRRRAGIPDVQVAYQSYGKTEAVKNKYTTKEGMREIIRREVNIELAFEGHRFYNLRRWQIAHTELSDKMYGWNVLGKEARTFYNDWKGPGIVWTNSRQFTAPRDYLFPLDAEQVNISSIKQNPGW